MAAKAVAFEEARRPEFQDYAHRIVENARALADELMKRGATVLTGGTDNHMVLVDVSSFGLTGKQAEHVLRQCHITLNRNSIPGDKNGPWYTSGIRLGTPALTTLGMGTGEMRRIAGCIVEVLLHSRPAKGPNGVVSRASAEVDPEIHSRTSAAVAELLKGYPLYPEIVFPDSVVSPEAIA
jgi:glycine hydroxymethyltransferase